MRLFWTGLTRTVSSKPVLHGSTIGILVFAGIVAIFRLLIYLSQLEELYMPSCHEFGDSFSYYNPSFILFVFLFPGQLVTDALKYYLVLGFLGSSTRSFMGYAISGLSFALVGVLVVSGQKVWTIATVTLLMLGFVLSYWLSIQLISVLCTL